MAPSFDRSANTVCVMDASGQLGTTLVQRLLQRGYTVHASVQTHGNIYTNNSDYELTGFLLLLLVAAYLFISLKLNNILLWD